MSLFRSASPFSEDEQPWQKRIRLSEPPGTGTPLADRDDNAGQAIELDSDDESVVLVSDAPAAKSSAGKGSKGKGKARSTSEPPQFKPQWQSRYFGELVVSAYMLYRSSAFCSLKNGEKVFIRRLKPTVDKKGKEKEDHIVRFHNSRDLEVGRVVERDAKWLCKLIDMGMVKAEGSVIEVPKKFQSGDGCTLSVTIEILAKAFEPEKTTSENVAGTSKKEGLETKVMSPYEKMLLERKVALNELFDRTNTQPVKSAFMANIGSSRSKRAVFQGEIEEAKSKVKGKVKAEEGTSEDGEELSQNQLNTVYSKASRNDAFLPEMEPADSFALSLRPYQKQALRWMAAMEGGSEEAREELSMHPLWEEYAFASKSPGGDREPFYYNPYSGELSLEFPRASKKCLGGILADEMGLGKTIMLASLIHTCTPEQQEDGDSSEDAPSSASESESEYVPSPAKKGKRKLQSTITHSKGNMRNTKSRIASKMPRATLVVAPMTLLAQWKDEIERTCKEPIQVLLYYGGDRSHLQEQIDGGVEVVITSYGVVSSEYQQWAAEEEKRKGKKEKEKDKSKSAKVKGKASAKPRRKGLFSVDWFRIVLDEAHTIRTRTAQVARACYHLRGERRWCLTGTPIINRLEDLYSLLHFLRLEPWGNWSFFSSFVTLPFARKDPKAVQVIQVVLESILLRREKSMKDKDGLPIVTLPKKHIEARYLDFSSDERMIYDTVFRNARAEFEEYRSRGQIFSNVTAIFALLTRLRLSVCHPVLVFKNKKDLSSADKAVTKMISNYNEGVGDVVPPNSPRKRKNAVIASFDCPFCMEPAEDPVVIVKCGHKGCKLCMLSHFQTLEDDGKEARCPLCQVGPVNETDLLTEKKWQAQGGDRKLNNKVNVRMSSPRSGDVIEILDSDEESSPVKPSSPAGPSSVLRSSPPIKSDPMAVATSSSPSSNGPEAVVLEDSSSEDDDDDSADEQADPKTKRETEWLRGVPFKSSTKLNALLKHINGLRDSQSDFKMVVFSQFTSFIDLIEILLVRERFDYVRLDGTMSQKRRENVVRHFTKASNKPCIMLASLKAAGVGLNLVAANHVVLMDCWWNDAIENQAIDRIHRFGQTREVYVTRYLIDSSIENKMIALQRKKRKVVDGALGIGQDSKSKSQLADDLAEIFADD